MTVESKMDKTVENKMGKIKKNIFIIGLYTAVMIVWSLVPPLLLIGGTVRESGQRIDSYLVSLNVWFDYFGFVKPFIAFCTVIILYETCVLALRLSNKLKDDEEL